MANILVFGASIAYGFADSKGGWVQRLRTYLDEKCIKSEREYYFGEVLNLGLSGEITDGLLERMETDAKPRLASLSKKTITLISIGINDSAKWNEKEGNWISIEKYKDNLKQIVEKAKGFSSDVFFVGITLVDESITKPVPWDLRISYLNSNIEEYNDVMKEIAEETDIGFIDLLPDLKKIEWNKLLFDGVHPDDDGHQKIFEIVKNGLEESKII